jgi:lipid-A-disaccharide synthase
LVTPGRSREVLAAADLALVASGTASTEAMFLGTPQVVAYKIHPLSWAIARRLVKTPFVSIANLVAGREIVPELLQDRATAEALADRAWPFLADPGASARARADLAEARSGLGAAGASARVADILAGELGL